MRQGTITTVPATEVAISLEQAKRQLRIEDDETSEDTHISTLCAAAHRMLQRDLGYPILREDLETHLDGFPRNEIWLGGGDSPEIVSISYRDTNDAPQTLPTQDYSFDAVSRGPRVHPAAGKSWPSTICDPSAVVITWRAGWNDPDSVPEDLILAMLMLVGHWDSNRTAVINGSISSEVKVAYESLIAAWRMPSVA